MHFFRLTFYVPVCGSFLCLFACGLLPLSNLDTSTWFCFISVLCIHFPQDMDEKMVCNLFPETSSENNSFFRKFVKHVPILMKLFPHKNENSQDSNFMNLFH